MRQNKPGEALEARKGKTIHVRLARIEVYLAE